jgi:hypothetical protein
MKGDQFLQDAFLERRPSSAGREKLRMRCPEDLSDFLVHPELLGRA